MRNKFPYKRILLKLSGETLMGSQKFGIDLETCRKIALSIQKMQKKGFEIAIVIGGGNIFRGIKHQELGIERTPADQMGMLATLINGIALQQALQCIDCQASVLSALDCPKAVESYNWTRALHILSKGHVVIFVGGTGNPYFTTDTTASLRASEIHAEIILKATKVDGVYDKDPLKYPDAKKYDELTYSQVLAEKLEVMDATAIAMCRSNQIPILVFNMDLLDNGKIMDALSEKNIGTMVKGD